MGSCTSFVRSSMKKNLHDAPKAIQLRYGYALSGLGSFAAGSVFIY